MSEGNITVCGVTITGMSEYTAIVMLVFLSATAIMYYIFAWQIYRISKIKPDLFGKGNYLKWVFVLCGNSKWMGYIPNPVFILINNIILPFIQGVMVYQVEFKVIPNLKKLKTEKEVEQLIENKECEIEKKLLSQFDHMFEREEALWYFYEQSKDLKCLVRDNGTFAHVNKAWSDALGWTKEELTTTEFWNFIHPDDLIKSKEAYIEGDVKVIFKNRYRKKNGDYALLSWEIDSMKYNSMSLATARVIAG